MEQPKGIILIRHSGWANITTNECLKVLSNDWLSLDRKEIEVDYSESVELDTLYQLNFNQCALEHRRQFRDEVLPLLEQFSDYHIVYFGLAPIPLAIDFGQLFHNHPEFIVYQRHHQTKEWYRSISEVSTENLVETIGMPDRDIKGIGCALIRISASHYVNTEETNQVLSNAAEIDIQFTNVDEDAINSPEQMGEMVNAVKEALDSLANNRSGLKTVHIFASIPCGLAFLIGTKISPNIHPFVQTYQYSKTENPSYKKAILIKASIEPERSVSEEDLVRANELRKLADDELQESVKAYCPTNKKMSVGRPWYLGVVPSLPKYVMSTQFWGNLPPLHETSLKNDAFGFELGVIEDGFCWRDGIWSVDDNFFIALDNRIKDENQIKQAIRLFLFHEALHYKQHNLTENTAVNIGSFPKVLESADYQADLYALLNEYGFSTEMNGAITSPKTFFLNAINTATETMWSFDDLGVELTEIQIRRLNRYMIWYWQYARIERFGDSMEKIIHILKDKPIIELNGLKTKEENNRFYFILEKRINQPLELGVFHETNKIVRGGSASNMPIENIVEGVKKMDGEKILNVLRSFIG